MILGRLNGKYRPMRYVLRRVLTVGKCRRQLIEASFLDTRLAECDIFWSFFSFSNLEKI